MSLNKQLNFTDEFHYPDDLSGISISVVLHYGEKSRRVPAKVDTGGGVCLFTREDGVKLGLVPIEIKYVTHREL